MSFGWPVALLGLVLVPLGVSAYVFAERRRARRIAHFTRLPLLPNLVPAGPGFRRHLPFAIVLLSLTVLVVGLARPHTMRSVPREQATVILTIDTSRSMAADDLKPTRFQATQAAANAFLDKVPGRYSVGIVAFSTKADVVLPPTRDREAARQAIAALRLGSGTAVGEAILTSLSAINPSRASGRVPAARVPPASILLMSDGAQTSESVPPLVAARRAHDLRVPIYTVAVGSRDAVVEVPLPGGLKERVVVAPDVQTLRQVARATDARAFEALDADQLKTVYRDLGSRLGRERKRVEMTSAFAAGGAVLLLLGSCLSTLWFRRPL